MKELSRIITHHQGNPDGSGEDVLRLGLGNPEKSYRCPMLPRVRQLLQLIYQRLLESGDAVDQNDENGERQIRSICVETRAAGSLRSPQKSVHVGPHSPPV